MSDIETLLQLMARLRDPEHGCPWDREQDFASIAPYTIEEAYEVADAVARDDLDALRDELGDLLFQVAFHSRMAEERGAFDFADVVAAIVAKMVRRHPHVYGSATVASAAEQTHAWERHKAAERRDRHGADAGALDGVALGLPALTRADKLQRRAARAGFDWPEIGQVFDKVREELDEVRAELDAGRPAGDPRLAGELGDLLFACVNLARHARVDPEAALRGASARFARRFRHVESAFVARDRTLDTATAEELDQAWEQAKREVG
jgi:MazG family protein